MEYERLLWRILSAGHLLISAAKNALDAPADTGVCLLLLLPA